MERMRNKDLENAWAVQGIRQEKCAKLEEENEKLKEFKTKREESMFYFKAQMERAEPKTAREAEDLQRAKEIFEKLYRKELSCLEEENKKLKKYYDRDKEELMESCYSLAKENDELKKENKKLKSDLAFERTMLDNVKAEYESLQNVNRKLKEDVDYRHHRAMVAERGGEDED